MKGFKKYLIALIVTVAIFAIAWFASEYFNNQKIEAIKDAQQQVTVDIMSSETQFDLLDELSCQDVDNNYLSQEISDLADQLTYAEQNLNDQSQISILKQQYSILEVKDFLLTQRISTRCKQPVTTILYFYKSDNSCADCQKQGYVLDALRQEYPSVRVYSFDAGLDSSTVRALLTVYKIPATLPALVIDDTTKSGFMSIDDIEKLMPADIVNPPPAIKKASAQTPDTTTL